MKENNKTHQDHDDDEEKRTEMFYTEIFFSERAIDWIRFKNKEIRLYSAFKNPKNNEKHFAQRNLTKKSSHVG